MLKVKSARIQIFLFLTSLLIGASIVFFQGIKWSGDTNTFLKFAKLLDGSLESDTFDRTRIFFYYGFSHFIRILVYIFGDKWPYALVTINVFSHATMVIILFRCINLVTKNLNLALFSCVFIIFSFDLQIRTPWLLTDSIYLAFSTLFMYLIINLIHDKYRRFSLFGAAIVGLLCFSLRPHGIIPLVLILLFSYQYYKSNTKISVKQPQVGILAIVTLLIVLAIAHGIIMKESSKIMGFNNSLDSVLRFASDYYREGRIISSVPETYHNTPNSLFDYLLITIDRFFQFFSFFPLHWSRNHTIISSIFFTPIYLLNILGFYKFFRRQMTVKYTQYFFWSFIYILGYASLSAMTTIDYEHRYRLPTLPILCFTSALILEPLCLNFREKTLNFIIRIRGSVAIRGSEKRIE